MTLVAIDLHEFIPRKLKNCFAVRKSRTLLVEQRMQDRWLDKRVDLKLLSEHTIQFFKDKNFMTRLEESPKEFKVLAIPKRASHGPAYQISENISVFIRGKPDDFSIEFVAGSRSRFYVRLGGFLSLFGAGGLMMQGLKSLEELQRLEDDFWKFIDKAVDVLSPR